MKFDITRQSILSTLFTLFIMSVVGLFALFNIEPVEALIYSTDSLLGGFVTELQRSYPTLSAIFCATTIFTSAVWLGRLASVFNLYGQSTTIQLFITCSLMWCVVISQEYLLASLLVALTSLAIGYMLRMVKSMELDYIFNASLALSVAPLLYPPAIVMLIALPIILIASNASLRVAIIATVGIVTLPVATIYIYWLCGADFIATLLSSIEMFAVDAKLLSMTTLPLFQATIVAIASLLAIISLMWSRGAKHRTRLRFLIIMTLWICAGCTIFIPSITLLSLSLLAPPLALAASHTLSRLRGIVATITYIIFAALVALTMFSPIYLPL